MTDAGSPSPFRRHSDDTTPIQRKVTHDYITRVREAMRRVMEELNIRPPEPHSGAVWAAAINLMYCSISLNELTPERMHAYGLLSAQAADRLEQTRDALARAVQRAAASSGHGTLDELPRLAGMPMLDVNEISQSLVNRKAAHALIARQKSSRVECSTTTRTGIQSRSIGISKPVCKSFAPLDGAKHRCAAQCV